MDNSLDTNEMISPGRVTETSEPQTVTERIEDALGKLLMKFKELETKLEDFDYRLDNLDSDVTDLRSDIDDFDMSRVESVEAELEDLKHTLRNI